MTDPASIPTKAFFAEITPIGVPIEGPQFYQATVQVIEEGGGYGFWGFGPSKTAAFEALRVRMLAFFQAVEDVGIAQLVWQHDPADPDRVIMEAVYPPSMVRNEVMADLATRLKNLLLGDMLPGGESPEVAEHEIAQALRALDPDELRKFLARIARTMLDEPNLARGTGIDDIMFLREWVRERFAVDL